MLGRILVGVPHRVLEAQAHIRRCFGRQRTSSGLHPTLDILSTGRHVSKVPRSGRPSATSTFRAINPNQLPTFGSILLASAMSASPPAPSPFFCLATPRQYKASAL